MTTNLANWTEATRAVDAAASILVVTHVKSDGDAIGSLLGLTNALRERGKTVVAAVDDGAPPFLAFIPGADTVQPSLSEGEWELMVSVDASDEERTGLVGIYGRAHSRTVINLDHHPTNTLFGDIFLVLPQAVSASEIVFEWLKRMEHRISREIAIPLLTGIVTDTVGFRTNNVLPGTLGIAQQLMEAGASLTEITARTLSSKPYNIVNLWKRVLPSVELRKGVISATITQADLAAARVFEPTDGGLVGFLIATDEAMVAVVFKELADGRVELSFRAKPGYDVAQMAFALGGGGHTLASGATIDGPVDAAIARVMPLARAVAKNGTLSIA